MGERPRTLTRNDGTTIAFHRLEGATPGVLFCTGFKSDMDGGKAVELQEWCRQSGRQMTRFDYRGHGVSGGVFEDSVLSDWLGDSLCVLDEVTEGPQIVVGSSMGGFIALLMALRRPERIAGLTLIAPAVDMTQRMKVAMGVAGLAELSQSGVWRRPSEYDPEGYVITRALIEDGEQYNLLSGPIDIDCPVRILHGMRDDAVPWDLSLKLTEALTSTDVEIAYIKSGDHRLSGDRDIARLLATVARLTADIEAMGARA